MKQKTLKQLKDGAKFKLNPKSKVIYEVQTKFKEGNHWHVTFTSISSGITKNLFADTPCWVD